MHVDYIQVHHNKLMVGIQDDVQEPLECCGCPVEARREDPLLPMA